MALVMARRSTTAPIRSQVSPPPEVTGNGNDVSLGAGPPADEVVIQQNPPPGGEVVGNGNDVSLGGSGVGDAGSVICYEIGTPCD